MKLCRACKKKEVYKPPGGGYHYFCRDCTNRNSKEWKERNRLKINAYNRKYHQKVKEDTLKKYGGKCKCCGETQMEFLSIDHVNGGGNIHRRKIKAEGGGTASMYRWLKKNGYPKKGFQVLCYNCNLAKGFYGECPHKLKVKSK